MCWLATRTTNNFVILSFISTGEHPHKMYVCVLPNEEKRAVEMHLSKALNFIRLDFAA